MTFAKLLFSRKLEAFSCFFFKSFQKKNPGNEVVNVEMSLFTTAFLVSVRLTQTLYMYYMDPIFRFLMGSNLS